MPSNTMMHPPVTPETVTLIKQEFYQASAHLNHVKQMIHLILTYMDDDQRWYWADEWQQREQEADADIAAGRVHAFDDARHLIDDLTS